MAYLSLFRNLALSTRVAVTSNPIAMRDDNLMGDDRLGGWVVDSTLGPFESEAVARRCGIALVTGPRGWASKQEKMDRLATRYNVPLYHDVPPDNVLPPETPLRYEFVNRRRPALIPAAPGI